MHGQRAAKEVCFQPSFTDRVMSNNLDCYLKRVVHDQQQNEWDANNNLRPIKNTVSTYSFSGRINHREEIIICCLKEGCARKSLVCQTQSRISDDSNRRTSLASCYCRLTVLDILEDYICYAVLHRKFQLGLTYELFQGIMIWIYLVFYNFLEPSTYLQIYELLQCVPNIYTIQCNAN